MSRPVTVLDKLTYSGNRATWTRSPATRGFAFVRGDICDAGLVDELMAGHDAVVHFAAESHVDRSIHGAAAFVLPTCWAPRPCSTRPAARGRPVPARLHRRGLRLDRRGLLDRGLAAGAQLALLGRQGRLGPDRAGLPPHPRAGRRGHPLLEQLRALPVPGEGHPAVRHQPARRPPVPLYGDGGNVRDWLHVADHCRGIDLALRRGPRRARSTTSAAAPSSPTGS